MAITRRSAFLGAVATALAAASRAELPDLTETIGIKNGRYWQMLSANEKIVYIQAADDAVLTFGPEQSVDEYFPNKAKILFRELAMQIDRIYSRPPNLVIPIMKVIPVAVRLFEGATEEGVESPQGALGTLRNVFTGK